MLNTSTRSTISRLAALRSARLALLVCVALAAVPCAALADTSDAGSRPGAVSNPAAAPRPAAATDGVDESRATDATDATDATQPPDTTARLDALLEHLDRTADSYRDHALEFGCVETIRWSGSGGDPSTASLGGSERFGYVFAHGDADGFSDYRTSAVPRPGDTAPHRVTPEDFDVPRYLGSAYRWIYTFKKSRWARHTYEIRGEETVLGRPVVRLGFRPVPPIEPGVNDWYGTAWVDVETGQLRKVEAYTPDDRGRLDAMERHAAGAGVSPSTYDVERITAWFDARTDDLRFPSRVEIRRTNYHLRPGKKHWEIRPEPVLQVDQTYADYEFFQVETHGE